jgi:hypothetical protein
LQLGNYFLILLSAMYDTEAPASKQVGCRAFLAAACHVTAQLLVPDPAC